VRIRTNMTAKMKIRLQENWIREVIPGGGIRI